MNSRLGLWLGCFWSDLGSSQQFRIRTQRTNPAQKLENNIGMVGIGQCTPWTPGVGTMDAELTLVYSVHPWMLDFTATLLVYHKYKFCSIVGVSGKASLPQNSRLAINVTISRCHRWFSLLHLRYLSWMCCTNSGEISSSLDITFRRFGRAHAPTLLAVTNSTEHREM